MFPYTIMMASEEMAETEKRVHEKKEHLWNSPTGAYRVLHESFHTKDKHWDAIENDKVLHSIKDHYEFHATRETQIIVLMNGISNAGA